MRELDFLFLYEHKVRELENLCLVKYELDRRGYKTEIRYIEDAENALAVKPFIHTKVLLVMACYNNETLAWQVKNFVKFDKVIDMQWENIVYPRDEKREGAFKNYSGIGKYVARVSWGKQNTKRMLEVAKMDPKKLFVTGHIGMDFLKYPLSKYYIERKELFEKYNIPEGKKVVLFASPYFGDQLDVAYINRMCEQFGEEWKTYYDFMCKSQDVVLEWIEKICMEDKEVFFVFRPHPGHPSNGALELAKRCTNFRVIGDESVKQWIVTCDKVYTGNSSVVVEAFFAQKMCQLLFPLPTTEGYELKLITESAKIKDYETFKTSIYAQNEEFPTPRESIEEIYLVDWEEPSYIKFADMAEEVLKDNYFELSKEQLRMYKPQQTIVSKLVQGLTKVDFLYRIYLWLINNEKINVPFLEKQRKVRMSVYQNERAHNHELTNSSEINCIIDKIKYALKND